MDLFFEGHSYLGQIRTY